MVLETHMKLFVTEPDFLGNFALPQNWDEGPKWAKNKFFKIYCKIWSLIFTEFDL